MLVVLSLFAALVLGGLLALAVSPYAGLALAALLLVAGVVAHRAQEGPRRAIGITLLLALLAGGSYGAVVAIDVVEALTTTQGTPEPADPAHLGSAEDKLAGLQDSSAFRLELTEPELQAVVQDGIASNPDLPIRQIQLDLRGPTQDMQFTATFKSGAVQAHGTAAITAVDGGIDVALEPLRFGSVAVPEVASGAVRALLGSVADLNAALAAQRATVQAIEVTDDTLVVIGTRDGGQVLTGGQLLESIRAQAAVGADAVTAPPEVLGPGTVDALQAPGEPVVLALGDSLAANAGVAQPRDGYVSRLHHALSQRDGVAYGLVNLGVAGETSGTLLVSGQLAAAEQVLASRPAAYVTIDIGANDLLGHLQSPDCASDLRSARCQQRVDRTLVAYRANLEAILDRLTAAAGGGRVALLQFYNPFSLGLGESEQEAESSAIVARANTVAAEVARARGVLVADGFTPLQGTTAATTHMLDPEPDIHPNAVGHDVLANALFSALP
ncbi:MAG TPA: SGNH/GDSL hydrolase family protein [Euzebya sp.]|nr:SGNH/GDSL hydrolase family protein [Euzebya sp.]